MPNVTASLSITQTATISATPEALEGGVLTPVSAQEFLVATLSDDTMGSLGSVSALGHVQSVTFTPAKIGSVTVTLSTQPPDATVSATATLTVTPVPISELDLAVQING